MSELSQLPLNCPEDCPTEGMSFYDAVPYLESGCAMRLPSWDDGLRVTVNWGIVPFFFIARGEFGKWMTYHPNQVELFSEEWILV